MFSYYECDLTATMTIVGVRDDLKSFQDVINQGYKVVVMESSADQATLKNSKDGTAINKFYYDTMHENPGACFNRKKNR